jgi:A/G-specific adenine glycosylase
MAVKPQDKYFTTSLLQWDKDHNARLMPWKGERDPYRIWLSEIILQQTRVEQGTAYYHRFINEFPTIADLANAPDTRVFKLWEGLGYYSRCKNLVATARYIHETLLGRFPDSYEGLLALKGVGPYTASAIASFAYGLPHAVVDGNVFRVLSRYFGIQTPVDSGRGKALFTGLANRLIDKKQPAKYNQALMDFGALVCKPRLPLCDSCPLRSRCIAFSEGKVYLLPIKEKSISRRKRWFTYLVANDNDAFYVRKRGPNDIWENLYEFILVETAEAPLAGDTHVVEQALGSKNFEVEGLSPLYKQVLTHQTIHGQFIRLRITKPLALEGFERVPASTLALLPFPKFISNFLKDKNVSLNLL